MCTIRALKCFSSNFIWVTYFVSKKNSHFNHVYSFRRHLLLRRLSCLRHKHSLPVIYYCWRFQKATKSVHLGWYKLKWRSLNNKLYQNTLIHISHIQKSKTTHCLASAPLYKTFGVDVSEDHHKKQYMTIDKKRWWRRSILMLDSLSLQRRTEQNRADS